MIQKFRRLGFCTLLLFAVTAGNVSGQAATKMQKQSGASKTPGKPATRKLTAGPVRIKISTDSGTFMVVLSDSTPLHRDNFVKLVQRGFYDSLLFHRVIPQFMIQGGDPASKNAEPSVALGGGGGDMARVPAEFHPSLYHKKGALAAARDGNPEKASSGCQFYIVDGKPFTDEQLTMLEQQKGFKYTPAQRDLYKTIGGTPQLDQNYTVFGEVESGLEVISKISGVSKDGMNRPVRDIRMKMEIIK